MSEAPDDRPPEADPGFPAAEERPDPRASEARWPRLAFVERLGYMGLAVTSRRDRADPAAESPVREVVVRFELPVFGTLALLFGVTSLFHMPIVMAPLALVFAFIALRHQQTSFGLTGLVCGIVGLITSQAFWIMIGLGWLWAELF